MKLPTLLKVFFTAFMAILVPAYWIKYGPANFLWFSDVTLILTYMAVLFNNPLLISMAAVGGIGFELLWVVDFLPALLFDLHLTNQTNYMFNPNYPIWLRALSLFHMVLPFLLLWLIKQFGYVRKAVYFQILLIWVVILTTWLLTGPTRNINWVFGYQFTPGFHYGAPTWLILEAFICASIIGITHLFLIFFSRTKSP